MKDKIKNIKNILKERAVLLSRETIHYEISQKKLEILEFKIEKEVYGLETQCVNKVYSLEYLTPLPGLPSFMSGIINIHGLIIPIIDIKKFFDLEETKLTASGLGSYLAS